MKTKFAVIAAALLAAGPVFADGHGASGDAEAGEKAFRQCVSCHVVVNDAGETLAGKAAKTGPNLYGVAGRVAGGVEDFGYSSLIEAANAAGITYDEDTFVHFIMDPSGYMSEATGESGRSKMSYKARKEEDAKNIYAYLSSLAAQ
jgi:cytochrome c